MNLSRFTDVKKQYVDQTSYYVQPEEKKHFMEEFLNPKKHDDESSKRIISVLSHETRKEAELLEILPFFKKLDFFR